MDLHIKSGEIVALCGPSGGGKLPLVPFSLMVWILETSIESLRRNIGLVSQDTDPSILILDEAFPALDSKSELLVRQALQRLMQNRTVLVIAHRLETVLMAERVFLLEDGYYGGSSLLSFERPEWRTSIDDFNNMMFI
ncbi:hypothetical protein HAX54_001126 [Datura stramonium]|uniref:Uncharacterized protein n=1 Tax=Datura stramonium TaxID=4076 RepID=A0ABS8RSA5_DATST|nr:hypothetical protein [Datura stramonium]